MKSERKTLWTQDDAVYEDRLSVRQVDLALRNFLTIVLGHQVQGQRTDHGDLIEIHYPLGFVVRFYPEGGDLQCEL